MSPVPSTTDESPLNPIWRLMRPLQYNSQLAIFGVNETIERDSWGSRRRTSSSARSWAGPLSQARGRWFPLVAHKAPARSTHIFHRWRGAPMRRLQRRRRQLAPAAAPAGPAHKRYYYTKRHPKMRLPENRTHAQTLVFEVGQPIHLLAASDSL